jgi:hypothetical protein
MNIKLVGILFSVGALLACGDSGSDAGGGPAGGAGAGPSTGGNGAGTTDGGNGAGTTDGGAGGGAPALTCQTACEAVFACGLSGDPQLCPGFTPADEDTFVPGCVTNCMGNMSLIAVVDPEDCPGTIDTLKVVAAADFTPVCEDGFPQGGAGGGT